MTRCIAVLFLAGSCFGQTVGQITDSITHQPIEGAQISYRTPDREISATSDANGAYSLQTAVRETRDVVVISKTGYATQRVILSFKAVAEAHNFELTPAARISGHVVDRETGMPLERFSVQARQRVQAEESRLGSMATAMSGADGSFSLTNLAPGDYQLQIDPPRANKILFGETKSMEPSYGITWFPGVPRLEMATPVTVGAGENREIEVRIQKRELHRLAGLIQVPEGMKGDGIWFAVRGPRNMDEGELPKAGPFHVDGLEEGSHTILASTKTTPGHARVFGSKDVELTNHSVDDLKLVMRPGVTLRAVVTMAEEKTDVPANLGLDPLPLDGWMPDTGTPGKTDRLRVDNLPPGQYWPGLRTPTGYAVVSVSYGGHPVSPSTAIDVEAPESEVAYVLTKRVGRVSGTVRDADQKPVPDAEVWLLPPSLPDTVDKFYLQQQGGGGSTRADANGAFYLSGLAPGKYLAIAVIGDDRHRNNVLFLRDQLRSIDAVVLEPGQSVNIDVRIVR